LKLMVASMYSVPFGCISISPERDDMALLTSLGSEAVQLRLDGFCRLEVNCDGNSAVCFCDRPSPSSTSFRSSKSRCSGRATVGRFGT
jgi:hypothetical protein